MPSLLNIDGVDVHVEGQGQDTIVMIHGWPDTHRVWDAQVEAFKTRLRCVRFTLPGYDVTKPRRPVSLAEMTQTIEHIVDAVSPARPVILMLHDWGCFFGYQFYVHHPQRVERIVGIDVGDVGNPEFVKSLPLISKLMVLSYQLWLAAAWRIGGGLGRRMTRFMAKALKAPGDPALISSDMNYPYYIRWTRPYGGYAHALPFDNTTNARAATAESGKIRLCVGSTRCRHGETQFVIVAAAKREIACTVIIEKPKHG